MNLYKDFVFFTLKKQSQVYVFILLNNNLDRLRMMLQCIMW